VQQQHDCFTGVKEPANINATFVRPDTLTVYGGLKMVLKKIQTMYTMTSQIISRNTTVEITEAVVWPHTHTHTHTCIG
jgi:hypothetical protein